MRQPIQRQLLGPLLAVAMLGSAVTALLAAGLGMRTVRLAEERRLQQLAATLTDAGFPLTSAVLARMAELSGARFVTLDEQGQFQQFSSPLTNEDLDRLSELPVASTISAGSDRRVQLADGPVRAMRIPVRTSSSRKLSLVILTPQERWNDLAWQAALPPLLAGLLAASGAALLAVLLSQRFVSRIHHLAARAQQLAAGRFVAEPPPPRDDELRDLAVALNTAAEQLADYEAQIRTGERLKTLGRLGAGMAHQLRNALTGTRMALDLHAAELPAAGDRESLTVAVRQLTLMESYLQRFLTLGRGERPAFQETDLAALVTDTLQLVEPICRHHGISVTWQAPPTPSMRLQADAESLRQMLLNLLMNAIEAVQPLPPAERSIGVELSPAGEEIIELRVWDRGPGPAASVADSLFERFVSDKPDGTGLGLSVAQEIAQSHGGAIRWFREAGRTVFAVRLAANPQASGEN